MCLGKFLAAAFFLFTFALSCTAEVKIDEKSMFPLTEDSKQKSGIKYGEWIESKFSASKVFPGTERKVWVYVPAEYGGNEKACVVVLQDGPQFHIGNVISNLLAKGEIPMMIAVASSPGIVAGGKDKDSPRANRTLEYDTPSPRFAKFVVSELLPFAETLKTKDGRRIILSKSGNDRMIAGFSSGAAAAFNAAWACPWEFSRVFTGYGSFTGLRGSFANATLVHKYEPKPLRIFMQSGSRDMWTCFGDWWSANQSMARALEFAGYDFKFSFGEASHRGFHSDMIMPDVMSYLWKDWPKPVEASQKSRNHILQDVLIPGEPFIKIADADIEDCLVMGENASVALAGEKSVKALWGNGDFHAGTVAKGLKADLSLQNGILKIRSGNNFAEICKRVAYARAVATRGSHFYALLSYSGADASLVSIDADGNISELDKNVVTKGAVGIAANENWLYVFDSATRRGYSYKVLDGGKIDCKQEFFFLHVPDQCDGTSASSAVCDDSGRVYLATSAGIQICDYNGRSAAILELPMGELPLSLAFGGEGISELFVVGHRGNVFKRKTKAKGASVFTPPPKIRVGAG